MGCISLNRACHDQNLYETHIVSHIWYFSWPHYVWPWMTFKGQIKYNWVFNGLYLLNGACYDQILHESHIGSPIHVYSLSVDLLNLWTGWPLKVKLGTMEVILSNIWINFTFGNIFTLLSKIWTDFSLIHFQLLVNFSHALAYIMTTYDFLLAKQAILSNVWTEFNLTKFRFWSTFNINWLV